MSSLEETVPFPIVGNNIQAFCNDETNCNLVCNKSDTFLSNLLAVGPFQFTGGIINSIKFKFDSKEHFTCINNLSTEIKDKIFCCFVHLSNTKKRISVVNSTTERKVKAVCTAFDSIHKTYMVANFHRFFSLKVRYGYIHDDLTIELLKSDDIITSDYTALVLFNSKGKVFIIRSKF